jgi:hypothetical protein
LGGGNLAWVIVDPRVTAMYSDMQDAGTWVKDRQIAYDSGKREIANVFCMPALRKLSNARVSLLPEIYWAVETVEIADMGV